MDTFWQTETVSPCWVALAPLCPLCCLQGLFAGFPLWGLGSLGTTGLACPGNSDVPHLFLSWNSKQSARENLPLQRVSSKLCSGHCSPAPLSLPQQLQILCPSTAVSFSGSISTPALGSPDWDVPFPELMAQLWHGLAWPKLTGFCLSLQGGHMLTPLPAATPMKPGSAVSTCVLLPRSLSRALSVPWLGGCCLPEGGRTVVHMGS